MNKKWKRFIDYAENLSLAAVVAGIPILGKLLVIFALILIGLSSFLFELYVLPEIKYEISTVLYYILILIGHWLLINILFNYYMAIFIHPGSPTMYTSAPFTCRKCNMPKPHRTHHCSVCQKCILRMDHHCPWINNCVGFYNHRFFFLFCLYTTIGCVYVYVLGFLVYFPVLYGKDNRQDVRDTIIRSKYRFLHIFTMPFIVGPPLDLSAEDSEYVLWNFQATTFI
ncbi:hypothetical protein GJ496_007325 [Pomphorhynchus laevis]|nr:hypothetical protein GJ496_007325 [Pomphorhynchus laevis]